MKYEYRIRAIFKDDQSIYQDRTYKGKIYGGKWEAMDYILEAQEYYRRKPYSEYIDKVVIERREVQEWEEWK